MLDTFLAYRHRFWIALAALLALLTAAPLPAQPLDPVVFVPGILGSRLEDQRGTVWGEALTSITRFPELELSADPQQHRLRATGILETIGILGPFRIGQYSGLLKTLKDLGFKEGETLFTFPYDWRRSNFATAADLDTFVEAQAALRGKRFILLAHSMGGLVARIYIHQYGGARRVSRLVTLGTPHLGSADAFWTFLNGMGGLKNFVAGGDATVQRVVYSFASLYEMLPAYKNCCFVGTPGSNPLAVDLHDPAQWSRFTAWIPSTLRSPARRAFIAESLSRATNLQRLVALPLPSDVRLFKIGGDLIETLTRVYLDPTSGTPLRWDRFGGDGTVPLYSASAGDPSDTEAALQKHATIFNDDSVKSRLRRILTPYTQPEPFAFRPVTGLVIAGTNQDLLPFSALDVAVEEEYLRAGSTGLVRVSVNTEAGSLIEGIALQGWIEEGRSQTALRFVQNKTAYVAAFTAPAPGGAYRVIVHVPGSGLFEDYFVSLP